MLDDADNEDDRLITMTMIYDDDGMIMVMRLITVMMTMMTMMMMTMMVMLTMGVKMMNNNDDDDDVDDDVDNGGDDDVDNGDDEGGGGDAFRCMVVKASKVHVVVGGSAPCKDYFTFYDVALEVKLRPCSRTRYAKYAP